MTIRIILSFTLLLSVACVRSQTTNEQWRDSLSVLNRQIMSSAYSSDLYLRKAAVNIELEQWDYAIETYGEILQKDPDNVAALFYRAYAQGKMRRYSLARTDYEHFLDLVPRSVEGRLGLAYILTKDEKKQEAMDQYNRLVEMFPDSAIVYASRASFEDSEKYHDLALYDWNKAVELAPDNTNYIVSKADLLIRMNRLEEAKRCLDLAVRKGVARGELREMYAKCRL